MRSEEMKNGEWTASPDKEWLYLDALVPCNSYYALRL